MNRRTVLRTGAILPGVIATGRAVIPALAQNATPDASLGASDDLNDPTARNLSDAMRSLAPLALLEALETAIVAEPTLTTAQPGATIQAIPWTDMLDTDLEHSLGGVILSASGSNLHDPDLQTVGGYIVFESVDIAYDHLLRVLGPEPNYGSTYAAGTKVWLPEESDSGLGIMRIGYVISMAGSGIQSGEGIIRHLDTVARSIG